MMRNLDPDLCNVGLEIEYNLMEHIPTVTLVTTKNVKKNEVLLLPIILTPIIE